MATISAIVYGNTIVSTWKVYINYSVVETPTTYKIVIKDCGISVGKNNYVARRTSDAVCTLRNGANAETVSVYFQEFRGINDLSDSFSVLSNTIEKTANEQNVTISFTINLPDWTLKSNLAGNSPINYGSSTSTVSVPFTIPALEKPNIAVSAERLRETPKGITVTATVISFAEDEIDSIVANINGTNYSMGTGTLDEDGQLSITKTFDNVTIGEITVYCTATGKGGTSDPSNSVFINALPKPSVTVTAVRGKQGNVNTLDVTAKVDSFAYDEITLVTATIGNATINLTIDGQGVVGEEGYITATGTFLNVTEGSLVVSAEATGIAGESAIYSLQVPSMYYTMDIGGRGKEIAFGASASTEELPINGLFTCNMDANFNGMLKYKSVSILDVIYPVGSIYMSVNDTNPEVLFGGTWEAWGQGCVPVGVDPDDTDFENVEATGGEKTHKLEGTEIPAHTHSSRSLTGQARLMGWAGSSANASTSGIISTVSNNAKDRTASSGSNMGSQTIQVNATHTHDSYGGNGAHNNLQPYITCYMWKRTA